MKMEVLVCKQDYIVMILLIYMSSMMHKFNANIICITVGAALYTEHLFKSSTVIGETFLDQQFWMYLYESAIALLLHTITNPSYLFTSLTESLIGNTYD